MNSKQQEKLLFRVATAAEILDISRSQAYALIADGTLKAIRLGKSLRVPADALREVAQAGAEK